MNFYAEDGIDKIIRENFFKDYVYKGVYLEVGAASPEYLSMGRHFRENGWQVICIEPNPHFCELHRRQGQAVLEYAAGHEDKDNVEFQLVFCPAEYKGGQVTYEAFSALKVKDTYRNLRPDITIQTIQVKQRKLDTLLQQYAPEVTQIDVLSIDVEGWELEVLEGFSIQRYCPRILVIENLFHQSDYQHWMTQQGYDLWKEIEPNQIYLRRNIKQNLKKIFTKFRSQ